MSEKLSQSDEYAHWKASTTNEGRISESINKPGINEDEYHWLCDRLVVFEAQTDDAKTDQATQDILDRFDLLTKAVDTTKYSHFALNIAARLARSKNPTAKEQSLAFLAERVADVQDQELELVGDKVRMQNHKQTVRATMALLDFGDGTQQALATSLIAKGLRSGEGGFVYTRDLIEATSKMTNSNTVASVFASIEQARQDGNFRPYALLLHQGRYYLEQAELDFQLNWETEVQHFFKQIGLEDERGRLMSHWSHDATDVKGGTVEIQVKRILEIEHEVPGSFKVLHDEFGIKTPARYPKEMLINQFLERDDRTKAYGVMIYPRIDGVGGFYSQEEALEGFYKNAKELDIGVRVVECQTKMDVSRRLVSLAKRYGPKSGVSGGHKMEFGIIGGHGLPDAIILGRGGKLQALTFEDIVRSTSAEHLRSFFVPHPPIVLVSCSTGVKDGIGQEISKFIDGSVIAPNEPTNIKEIIVNRLDDGRLDFVVRYQTEGTAIRYIGGNSIA